MGEQGYCEQPTVSVVVPTVGRGTLLYNTLTDLLGQSVERAQIIVVDQSQSYSPEEQRKLNSLRSRVTFLRLPVANVVRACNLGVRHAGGEIVVLVDDDVRISDPGFLRAHVECYDDPHVGGVAGRIMHQDQTHPRPPDRRRRCRKLPWMFLRFDTDQGGDIESGGAGNLSFRKRIWDDLWGFDERFVGNAYRWESDFCFRLRRQGNRLIFAPQASLVHLYGTPGGCENRRLTSNTPAGLSYLKAFFRNNVYFYLKNERPALLPLFLCRLYREHVGNRAYAAAGGRVLLGRHVAFVTGNWLGFLTWLSYLRDARSHS